MLTPEQATSSRAATHTFASIVITSSRDGRIDIAGDLDVLTAPAMIDAALASTGDGDLPFDFSRVVFIDAAGLGGLVVVQRELAAHGRRLRVLGASPRIARTFALGGLGALLTPAPDPAILDKLTAAVLLASPRVLPSRGRPAPELRT